MNETEFHPLDAHADIPDARDLIYRPGLTALKPEIDPRGVKGGWWSKSRVRDQGADPSCTGHALASVIDQLLVIDRKAAGPKPALEPAATRLRMPYASAFMLYGNAQLHDEWHGEGYSGSSLRGAIKGFHHNGVCSIEVARKILAEARDDKRGGDQDWRWYTNADVTEDARKVVLGAYLRVRPLLTDMHCAVTENKLLAVTARIHSGWNHPGEDGIIPFDERAPLPARGSGFHAFAVIGYTDEGFIIQNSWGREWGRDGTAIWTYEDWSRNVADAWIIRLAAPVSRAFRYSVGLQGVSGVVVRTNGERTVRAAPNRLDVLGHLLPIVDGRLQRHGPFHHDPKTIAETIRIIKTRHSPLRAKTTGKRFASEKTANRLAAEDLKYRHVLIHVMAGGRTAMEAASYVRALHPVYRENGIYPVFLLWEPALFDELRLQVGRLIDEIGIRAQTAGPQRDEMIARLAEIEATEIPGRLRRELERSIRRFFYVLTPDPETTPEGLPREIAVRNADGIRTMDRMFAALAPRHDAGTLSYHMIGHDIGARFVAEFLSGAPDQSAGASPVISNLHLISPMIERKRFQEQILPALAQRGEGPVNRRARRMAPVVERTFLWRLGDDTERLDRFHPDYPMNWPQFWARVMGIMIKRDRAFSAPDANNAARRYEEIDDSGDKRSFPVLRSLALSEYADPVAADAIAQGAQLEIQKLPLMDEHGGDRISHFRFDGSRRVVNAVLRSILGADGVSREFTELDWQLSRQVYESRD